MAEYKRCEKVSGSFQAGYVKYLIFLCLLSGFLLTWQPQLSAQSPRWAVVMSQDSGYARQSWWARTEFPGQIIDENWRKGYHITSLTFGNGAWFLVMSTNSGLGQQAWRTRDYFPKNEIKELWDQGFQITELCYGQGRWALVMSKGTKVAGQRWSTRAYFPEKRIKELWDQGCHITHLAYGNGTWALVMSEKTGLGQQAWRTRTRYPRKEIKELWGQGFKITQLTYGDGAWALVMSKGSGYGGQRWSTNSGYPDKDISKNYGDNFQITDVTFGGARPQATVIPDEPPVDPPDPVQTGAALIYAVVVGVGEYQFAKDLRFTSNDANKFASFLRSPEGGSLPSERLVMLLDRNASERRILNAMKTMFGRADENDTVLLFFAGHGGRGFFCPNDYKSKDRTNRLLHRDVKRIFESSRARGKICIADACFSGGLYKRPAGLSEVLQDYYSELTNARGGLALLMSSKENEKSLEAGSLQHGVFTYCMINGLYGSADENRNNIVTISELHRYVSREVKTYTKGRQNPVLNGTFDPNLPVGVVLDGR